jgi:hypothetical protein
MKLWGLKESTITFLMGILCGIIFMAVFMSRGFDENKLKDLIEWQADYIVIKYLKEMKAQHPDIPSGSPLDQDTIDHENQPVPTGSFN